MKVFIKAFFATILLLIATTVQANDRVVLGYWSFNQGEFSESSFPLAPDVGERASFTLINMNDYSEGLASFSGSTLNRLDSSFPAGGDLAIRGGVNTVNNGVSLLFTVDMSNLVDLEISWAQRGTASGFNARFFSYSLDGEEFVEIEAEGGTLGNYAVKAHDLSGITELNGAETVYLSLTLVGATTTAGNHRFDNVLITALGAADADRITMYSQDFTANPFQMGWSQVAVSGNQRWDWNGSFGNVSFAPFVGGCQANENWLVSPAFNLDSQIDERLNFDVTRGFPGDNPLEVYYTSVAQNGTTINPEDWVLLTTITSADFTANNAPQRFAGFEQLQELEGNAHIAFRFNYETGDCGTWRIAQFDMSALLAAVDPVEFSCGAPVTRIHQVQGFGFQSQMQGAEVQVEAVVTGVYQDMSNGGLGGFFLQEKTVNADDNPLTSEGIFVYDAGFGVPVAVGDVVRVQGTVNEYFNNTQISDVTNVEVCATGKIDAVTTATFNLPISDFIELESVEGMLVQSEQPLTVTEAFNAVRFGEIQVSNGRLFEPTQVATPGDAARAVLAENNRNKIIFDNARTGAYRMPFLNGIDGTELNAANPIRTGFIVAPEVTGHMGFSFGAYRVHVGNEIPFVETANQRPEPIARAAGANLRVATYNVENLFASLSGNCGPNNLSCRGASSEEELERQLGKLVPAIIGLDADVIALVELENDANDATIAMLVNALNEALDADVWAYVATGYVGTDAIKNGFIYRKANVATVGDFAILDSSVDPDFDSSRQRPALAQTFLVDGFYQFTAVGVHLRAKPCSGSSGANADSGDGQGCWNQWRTLSAQAMVRWLDTNPTNANSDDFIVLGDFNAYALEDPLTTMYAAGFVNATVEANYGNPAVYSYVFRGQSGSLDHAVVNSSMASRMLDARVWHINADELPVFSYNIGNLPSSSIAKPENFYAANPFRSSDHDPLVVDFFFETPQPVDPETSLPRGLSLPADVTAERFTVPGSNNTSLEVRYEMGERMVDASVVLSPSNRIVALHVNSAVHQYEVAFTAAATSVALTEEGMWEVTVGNHTLHLLAAGDYPVRLVTAGDEATNSVYANEQAEIEFASDYQAHIITDNGYEDIRAVVTTNHGLASFFSINDGTATVVSAAEAGVSATASLNGEFSVVKGEQTLVFDATGSLTLDSEAVAGNAAYLWAGDALVAVNVDIADNTLVLATDSDTLLTVNLGLPNLGDTAPTAGVRSVWQSELFGAVYTAEVDNLEFEVLTNGALFVEQLFNDHHTAFSALVSGVTATVVTTEVMPYGETEGFAAQLAVSADSVHYYLAENGFVQLQAEGAEVAIHRAGSNAGFTSAEHAIAEYSAGEISYQYELAPHHVAATRVSFDGTAFHVFADGFMANAALTASEAGYEQQVAAQNEAGLTARVVMMNSEIIARFEQCGESCNSLGNILPSSLTIPADAIIHLSAEDAVNARIRMKVSSPIVFE